MPGASPKRGKETLRELAVFPQLNPRVRLAVVFRGGRWIVTETDRVEPEIRQVREDLKTRTNNIVLLLRLGNLLKQSGETNEAKDVFIQVEQLCRRNAETRPGDGVQLTHLGAALWGLDKLEEAEVNYRKAVLVSSNQSTCWFGLGIFLSNRSYAALLPQELRDQIDFVSESVPQEVFEEILNYRPPLDSLPQAEALGKEASLCLDRAVASAPRDSGMYFQRGANRCFSDWKDCFIRHTLSRTALRSAFYSEAAIPDFKTSADLNASDYRFVALPGWFEWASATIRDGTLTFETLPEPTRKSIQQTMTRLQNLTHDPDPKIAAGACEMAGLLNMLMSNKTMAMNYFRQATSIDPAREQSWDLLLALSVEGSPRDDAIALCESRIKQRNSARDHLLLAKLLDDPERWDKAMAEVDAALALKPNDITAHLTKLALALRQSADHRFEMMARAELDRTGDLLKASPREPDGLLRRRETVLNAAILAAIQDKNDAARKLAELVLGQFPGDERAKAILSALDQN